MMAEGDSATTGSPSASEQSEAEETNTQTHEPNGGSDTHTPNVATEITESRDQESVTKLTTEDFSSAGSPPLPKEPLLSPPTPTLLNEPVPQSSVPAVPSNHVPHSEDDGWEYHWVPTANSFWFYNRFRDVWQESNPRASSTSTSTALAATTTPSLAPAPGTTAPAPPPPPPLTTASSIAGGYNPAIHGDYDPNAWYAKAARAADEAATADESTPPDPSLLHAAGGHFNRRTGAWQQEGEGAERHTDEAKSRRQMNAFFDVDAAADVHDGRSLRAERAGKKPSKAELKAFKEKRKARKEEKRRAWLRD